MSKQIEFSKYQGTGNDFILIDGFHSNTPHLSNKDIQKMCHRRFGIGADGLIILKKKEGYDFDMDFYNSDGFSGSMCGNGGRCVVAFAHDIELIKKNTTFWAPDGEHKAIFNSHQEIALKMKDVSEIFKHSDGLFMDTGSPHLVIFEKNITNLDALNKGKSIRYSENYKLEGVNVNFVEMKEDGILVVTYERGVEDITYSCGTGTVASALAAHINNNSTSPINASTRGGILKVKFTNTHKNEYSNIWLEGPAIKSYSGTYKLN